MSETQIGSVVFEELNNYDHEQVVFCRDRVSGLRAIIGIHSTVLGPRWALSDVSLSVGA